MKNFKLIYISCFVLLSCIIQAQYSSLKFESYSTANGLSSSTCLDIFQDSSGFLWFGTIDGLNKYDGYSFEIFRPSLNDQYSISNNRINAITEDNQGNLWIGTSNGLNVFDVKTEKFYRIRLGQGGIADYNLNNVINDLYYDANLNCVWVATGNGTSQVMINASISKLPDAYSYKYYYFNPKDIHSIDNNTVTNIIKDSEGDLWFGTVGKSLNKFLPDKSSFQRYPILSKKFITLDHLPKVLVEDNQGDLWLGNDLSSMLMWDRSSNKFVDKTIVPDHVPVFNIYVDSKGLFWIATDGFGIYLYDKNKGIIQHIKHDIDDPFSLPNNQVSKILEDNTGIFWLATYNEGICKLALSKSTFKHFFHKPGDNKSLSTKIAQSVLEDSHGQIWVGTDGGGLNLFNEEKNQFKHFFANEKDPHSISSNKILYLEESYNGNIWVCTWDGGLNEFNPKTMRSKRYLNDPDNPSTLSQNTVWCAVEDEKHGLWLGTQSGGLNYLAPGSNSFIHFNSNPNKESSLISNFVFSLFIDSKQRLFIGTSLGLCYTSLDNIYKQNFNHVQFSVLRNSIIHGKRINFITEDHLGNIWLGTDLGLHLFDQNLKYQRSFTTDEGLPNNLIVGIQEDHLGYLWITSKGGLSRFDPRTSEFKNYNRHDGVQGLEFQSKSIDIRNNGEIIIGGINGINIFNPQNFVSNTDSISPMLTRIRLFNNIVRVGDTVNKRVLLKEPISELKQLELKYNEGYISFDFVALNYFNSEKVQYAYRMEDLDKDYIIAGLTRTANYSNLPPGEYVFEVKASLTGKWENAPGTSLMIKIAPPPWKTWWAFAIYFVLLILVVWGSLKYYTRLVKEEKERELDHKKLQFFINVAHEFRTPLTLILNPIEKILSSYDRAELVKESSLIIQRSARRLLNLVNQLLDFRKMDIGKSPLEITHDDIVKFCKDISVLFKDLADAKHITFDFSCPFESIMMDFDADKTEKIITNLLTNAVKFTNEGGHITFSVTKKENNRTVGKKRLRKYLEIRISDTGIGIKKEHQKNVFNRFFNVDNSSTGTGIGLNFTKGLVELHEGEISLESEYQKGSTFIVYLPIRVQKKEQGSKYSKLSEHIYNLNAIQAIEYDISIGGSQLSETDKESEVSAPGDKSRPLLLIVEDNRELRIHLKNELSTFYKVKEAVHGKQGLEMVNKFYPDIIISDVMMPEMDGFEFCRRVKSEIETCHIPIILLTARSLEEDKIEGFKTGADEYLPKPFNILVLIARINNLLEIKKKLRDKFASIGGIVPSNEITSNSMDEAFLDKATKIVLDNIDESNFSLENLSELMGVSRSQFYRKIYSITGQNPSNFIRTIRLKYAAGILLEEKLSIKEIAYSSGFNSSAYFSKTFRELFGITPLQYIEQHKKPPK